MRKTYFSLAVVCATIFSSCTREGLQSDANSGTGSLPPATGTSLGLGENGVFAGGTIFVYEPATECQLNGTVSGKLQNAVDVLWRKISGPEQGVIKIPERLHTPVSNLSTGVYEYELRSRSGSGAEAADTVKVIVGKVGHHELFFQKLQWIHPWYESLTIENIYSYVPATEVMKVYVRRAGSAEWQEVPLINTTENPKYNFFIESRSYGAGMYGAGNFYIFYYGSDTNDSPDVKIVY